MSSSLKLMPPVSRYMPEAPILVSCPKLGALNFYSLLLLTSYGIFLTPISTGISPFYDNITEPKMYLPYSTYPISMFSLITPPAGSGFMANTGLVLLVFSTADDYVHPITIFCYYLYSLLH